MYDAIKNSTFVALGGALGTLLRHGLNLWAFTPAFPVGTVIENLTGALLLGIVTGFLAHQKNAPEWLRTGVGVGFCGGYTTMSTFAADAFMTGIHQSPALAAIYVAVSLVFGLAMAGLGLHLGGSLGQRHKEAP